MNTKAILMSVLMIGVVVTAAGAGTLAFFSDVERANNNTFTAGTIDISVDDQNPWTESYKVCVPGDCSENPDLKPSQIGYINVTVENVGTNTADLYKKIARIDCTTGDTSFECILNCGDVIGVSSEPECQAAKIATEDLNDIDSYMYYDLYVDGECIIADGTIFVSDVAGYWVYLGQLGPGETMEVSQSYHLFGCTPNNYQGDVMEFDEVIKAFQVEGAQPHPSPIYSPNIVG